MSSRRILAVNPPNVPYSDSSVLMPRPDLLQDAALLKDLGYEVAYYDMDLERATKQDLVARVRDEAFSYTYFLFDGPVSLHSGAAFNVLRSLGAAVRTAGSRVVIAGMTPSYFHRELLEQPDADVVLVGPTGPAIVEYFGAAEWPRSHVSNRVAWSDLSGTHTPSGLVSTRPVKPWLYRRTAYELAESVGYLTDTMPVLASRGCGRGSDGCTFCPNGAFWNGVSYMPAEMVKGDINALAARGQRKMIFLDCNFAHDPDWVRSVLVHLRSLPVPIRWGCLCRADMDLRLLADMVAAGMRFLQVGVESGDEGTLLRLRKGVLLSQIRETFKEARRLGVRTRASVILDGGQTCGSVDSTFDFLMELAPDEVKPHFLAPRPYALSPDRAHVETAGRRIPFGKQGIFEAGPVIEGEVGRYAEQVLDRMAVSFRAEGYHVVLSPREGKALWAGLSTEQGGAGKSPKFLCLPPAPYGIGW